MLLTYFLNDFEITITILLLLLLLLLFLTFMYGPHNYIPQTNHVFRVYIHAPINI
jgi:hypothetical protein